MGVFELWEEAKVSRDNPHKLGEICKLYTERLNLECGFEHRPFRLWGNSVNKEKQWLLLIYHKTCLGWGVG